MVRGKEIWAGSCQLGGDGFIMYAVIALHNYWHQGIITQGNTGSVIYINCAWYGDIRGFFFFWFFFLLSSFFLQSGVSLVKQFVVSVGLPGKIKVINKIRAEALDSLLSRRRYDVSGMTVVLFFQEGRCIFS